MTRPPVGAASWQRPLLSVVLIALAWHLREAIILFFGAVLVAATLHALADPLVRRGLLGPRAALATVVAAVISGLAIGLWLLGDPLAQQLQALRVELPKAWTALHEWLQRTQVGVRVLAAMGDLGDLQVPWARIANVAGSTLRVLGEVVLMLLIGLYLASDTRLYREALLRLVPAQRRPAAADAIDVTGEALKRWLLGQAVAMLVIGLAVTVGLSLMGMPMAAALGLIAGLMEFVPFIGPIVSGGLAVVVAFGQGPTSALYVALLFVAVQQVENHVLVPLVQRWAVALPPALALGGVIVAGALFGPLGVVFGTPLVVVTMVLVQRLWLQE